MLKVNNLSLGGPAKGVALTYQGNTSVVGVSNVFTFTGVPFGAAGANREIVVAGRIGTAAITSITIGGVAATISVNYLDSTNGNQSYYIAHATVPTGTSGTVVINTSDGGTNTGRLAVFSLTGAKSTTPVGTVSAKNTLGVNVSCNLNVSAGGVALAFCEQSAFTLVGTPSWTGLTKIVDVTIGSTDVITVASASTPTSTTQSISVTNTSSGSFPEGDIVAASWV